MKTMLKNLAFLAFLGFAVTFSACKKDDEVQNPTIDKSAQDNAVAESEFDASMNINDLAMNEFDGDLKSAGLVKKDGITKPFKKYNESCATVTIELVNETTKKLILDFGSTGCEGPDGKVRKGKVIITFSKGQSEGNPYNVVGRKVTTTFDGYFVNNVKVEGTKEVTRLQSSTPLVRVHNIKVTGGKLTYPDNTTITWASDRTRTWKGGYLFNLQDDEMTISGTYSGSNRDGVTYSGKTLEGSPLLYKSECLLPPAPQGITHPASGKLEIKSSAHPDAVIDFGNGTCDKTFTVTVNGKTYTVNG